MCSPAGSDLPPAARQEKAQGAARDPLRGAGAAAFFGLKSPALRARGRKKLSVFVAHAMSGSRSQGDRPWPGERAGGPGSWWHCQPRPGCPRGGRAERFVQPSLATKQEKNTLPSAARNSPGLKQPKSFQGGVLKCWEFGLSGCASGSCAL